MTSSTGRAGKSRGLRMRSVGPTIGSFASARRERVNSRRKVILAGVLGELTPRATLCHMSSLTVSTTIARSPAEVYELLDDLANHEQFTDHFLVDWHMTREDTRGVGAGVRLKATVGSHRDAEITVIESSPS